MTVYRCVCLHCTGYIKSSPEPFYGSVEYDEWQKDWKNECDNFLSRPCPHYGDGIENSRTFAMFEKGGDNNG